MTEQATETPAELLEHVATIARVIAEDAEADAAKYDGKAMTGRDLGELHGETMAYVHALAGMVGKLAELVRDAVLFPAVTVTAEQVTYSPPDLRSVVTEAYATHRPDYPMTGMPGDRVCRTCGRLERFHHP